MIARRYQLRKEAVAVIARGNPWIFRDQRDQISRSQAHARRQLLQALQARALAGRFSRQMGQRFESLEALVKATAIARELKLPPEQFDSLRYEAIACLTRPDLRPEGRVLRRPPDVIAFAFDSAMTRYALRFRDGTRPAPDRWLSSRGRRPPFRGSRATCHTQAHHQ